MTDLYDNVDWNDMGMFAGMAEEFEEEAIKYLRTEMEFEKNNADNYVKSET